MKQDVKGKKQLINNTQILFMSIAALLILISVMLLSEQLGDSTLFAMIIVASLIIASLIRIEFLKRKYNLKKYKDIIAYLEDGKVSDKSHIIIGSSLVMWIVLFVVMTITVYLIVR